ncbi:E3 SUMO-protein ligase ZBED1-like [Haliotis cracherodii]|uniref:E3 SUMO-protein ligase ZBED1-like n=1 Tax=Haliotis cracherodii TaxID=6455 RepID=UPI0039E79F29
MLERYIEQQTAVFATLTHIRRNVKDIVTLNDDNIHNIEDIIKVLKPLKTVATLMCSKKHPTASLIHSLKEMLLKQLEVCPNDRGLVSDVKQAINNDLNRRYSKDDTLSFLQNSSALDRRFKALPYIDSASRRNVYHSIGQSTVELHTILQSQPTETWTEPNLPMITEATPSTSGAGSGEVTNVHDDDDDDDDGDAEPPAKVKAKGDKESCALSDLFGDVFVTHVEEAKSLYERTESEISMYKEDEVPSLESDPLSWWRVREGKYPLLSKYAKQCLGTPATSVASERVFSTAGDVVTAQRASLSSDNVDMLVILSKNMIIPDDLIDLTV